MDNYKNTEVVCGLLYLFPSGDRRYILIQSGVESHRQRRNGLQFISHFMCLRISAVLHGITVMAVIPTHIIEHLPRVSEGLILHGIAVVRDILLCGCGVVHSCCSLQDLRHSPDHSCFCLMPIRPHRLTIDQVITFLYAQCVQFFETVIGILLCIKNPRILCTLAAAIRLAYALYCI